MQGQAPSAAVTFCGTRGTIAVEGCDYLKYGGATICVLARLGGQIFVLDAGTGLMNLGSYLQPPEKQLNILLSHPHVDHLAGLTAPLALPPDTTIKLYGARHCGLDLAAQIKCLMSPPLWPVGLEALGLPIELIDLTGGFNVGEVDIRVMEGRHPGGCTVFRLDYQEDSLVYVTDCELETGLADLEDFAKDCTLLLCDGQYSPAEIEKFAGYGHSSWLQAGELALKCGAKQLGIIHHAPWRTDQELETAQQQLRDFFPDSFFAKKGECVYL